MLAEQRHNVSVSGRSDGQPMVFAHGFGCDQNMWRYVAPAFEATHRVVLFDYVGFGDSDHTSWDAERYSALEGYSADVVTLCDELGVRDGIFVGHSVSAMIGALANVERPDLFSSLVMVGPSPCYLEEDGYHGGFTEQDIDELLVSLDSNYLGWSANLAPVIMGNADRPALGQELTASFCRVDPAVARTFAHATFLSDHRDLLPRITADTLVLQCRDDAIAPLEVGEYVHQHVPGSTLRVLAATGHCPNLSAPEETTAAISEYLSARPGA